MNNTKMQGVTATVEYGHMVNVHTPKGELRLIFNEDGSFRLITDLKVQQVKDLAEENKDFWSYQKIVKVEPFGYPED